MHPQQLIGLGKLTYSSIKDTSPYSFAIFGVNYAHRGINRRLLRYGGEDIRPDVFGIEVTNYCSRVCEGCYVPEEIRNDMEVIDEHLLLSSISQAKKFGIRNFGFLGGEPMNKHTIPLTLKAVSKNPLLSFVYCTNGDYIAKNDVSYFQKHNNVGFLLSLDGFEDMNDSIRGKNAYSNVMDASKQLSSLRKIISASVTVRDNNIDEVFSDDFINHLIDNGFKYVVWIKYKHNGSGINNDELSDEEFIKRLGDLKKSTMTKPIFQQTNIFGDFFTFKRRSAHHTIYMGIEGDIHIDREEILSHRGNLNKNTLEEILKSIRKEYSTKYNF